MVAWEQMPFVWIAHPPPPLLSLPRRFTILSATPNNKCYLSCVQTCLQYSCKITVPFNLQWEKVKLRRRSDRESRSAVAAGNLSPSLILLGTIIHRPQTCEETKETGRNSERLRFQKVLPCCGTQSWEALNEVLLRCRGSQRYVACLVSLYQPKLPGCYGL